MQDPTRETTNSKARDDMRDDKTNNRRTHDDTLTECGLTREELRALVIEMIG